MPMSSTQTTTGHGLSWLNNATERASRSSHSSSSSFYFSLGLITLPGIVTNSLALFFIVRDMRKAVFPAIILIFTLCATDLSAVIFSLIRHMITRYVSDISYSMCACISVPHTFFRTFSGVTNSMMAVDRVFALSYPFFYKLSIDVVTWKIGCSVAAFCTAIFSMFPMIGLGDIMTTVIRSSGVQVDYCSTFSYRSDPTEKVYGLMFAIVGYLVVIMIVAGNILVIRSILRLSNRIDCGGATSNSSSETRQSAESRGFTTNNATTFEIAFAKLMGCLAAVYLICEVPYNTLILLQQFDVTVDPSVKGLIHMLGGLSYWCDPIVYILIRKVKVSRIINFLCRCRKQDNEIIREMNIETRPGRIS